MILEIQNLTKHFGGLVALSNINLQIEEGVILGLIGPNGAGKTTLFNCISGLIPYTSGEIFINGKSTKGLLPHDITKTGTARTFQIVKPFGNMTTLENAMVGAFCTTSNSKHAKEIASDALKTVFLDDRSKKLAKHLNLGERKKLEIAKALATKPKLLLLDEVMAGLTPPEVSELLSVIRKINKSGVTILVIEHIMDAIMNISDHIFVINFGNKIAEGTPQEIINNQQVIEAYFGIEEGELDA